MIEAPPPPSEVPPGSASHHAAPQGAGHQTAIHHRARGSANILAELRADQNDDGGRADIRQAAVAGPEMPSRCSFHIMPSPSATTEASMMLVDTPTVRQMVPSGVRNHHHPCHGASARLPFTRIKDTHLVVDELHILERG